MTEEHKRKIQEGRKRKAEEATIFEIGNYVIESYDYGWSYYDKTTVFENNQGYKQVKRKFYSKIEFLLDALLDEKLGKQGKTSVQELTEAIEKASNFIMNSIPEKIESRK